MDKYKETFETWNKVASLYEEKFMDLDIYDETYDLVCHLLPAQAKLFEIGCGPGNITRYLLNHRPDLDIHGIDIAPKMIELAKKNNPTAYFSRMDTRNIDQLTTKYDAIICGFILPYLSDSDHVKLISDSKDLLNNNGLIYISFYAGDPKQSGFVTGSTGDRSYFYYHDLKELERNLVDQQFKIIKRYSVDYQKSATEKETHTILLAKKDNT